MKAFQVTHSLLFAWAVLAAHRQDSLTFDSGLFPGTLAGTGWYWLVLGVLAGENKGSGLSVDLDGR